jgi:hypothetical protein
LIKRRPSGGHSGKAGNRKKEVTEQRKLLLLLDLNPKLQAPLPYKLGAADVRQPNGKRGDDEQGGPFVRSWACEQAGLD